MPSPALTALQKLPLTRSTKPELQVADDKLKALSIRAEQPDHLKLSEPAKPKLVSRYSSEHIFAFIFTTEHF
jgi:hypothetical protein